MKYNIEGVNYKVHVLSYIRFKVDKNMEKFSIDFDVLLSNSRRNFNLIRYR